MQRACLSTALVVALVAVSGKAYSAQQQASIEVRLKPALQDEEIRLVQVVQTVSGVAGKAGEVLFTVPQRVTTILGQNYRDGDIIASDIAGPLPLKMEVMAAPASAPLAMRTFKPLRATFGPITLRYTADVTPALTPRKPGPSYDLRGADGGFGGAFFSFLLLPASETSPRDFRLVWDLSSLPKGARGVSTLGEGDVAARIDPQSINTTFFLGGKVEGHAAPGSLFRAYWIGRPPFDVKAAAAWSDQAFNALRSFFKDQDTRPYTLLMRPYTRPRDGGGATRGGFMLEYGAGAMTDAARRIMFTHEMIHHFVGHLSGETGRNAWFGEGLAEFYKIRIPARVGLLDLPTAAREIAVMTNAYYMSPAAKWPMAEVGARRWASGAAQSVPYNRGFMYFVAVDAAMRAKSAGRRSLDDLVQAMLTNQRAGLGYDEAKWRELLRSELGEDGITQFERMLAGELIIPPENAFGPCFSRTRQRRPRPVLGFSEDVFLMEPRVIRNLEPGSAAAQAGLREGDEVISFSGVRPRIAHSAPNVALEPMVRLVVRRGGESRLVRFSTEGPLVDEYRWNLTRNAKGCTI